MWACGVVIGTAKTARHGASAPSRFKDVTGQAFLGPDDRVFRAVPKPRAGRGRVFHGWCRCSPIFPEGCLQSYGFARLPSHAVRENRLVFHPYWPCFAPLDLPVTKLVLKNGRLSYYWYTL